MSRGPIGGCGARWSSMVWLRGWLRSDLASHGRAYERSVEIEGDTNEIEDDANEIEDDANEIEGDANGRS